MKIDLVFSPHVFRVHVDDKAELPMTAPEGSYFYLVTTPTDAKKKYFTAAPRGGKGSTPRILAGYHRNTAMKFTDLKLAESFAAFVNNPTIFPEGAEFWIILERAGYQSESRTQLTSVAGA